MKTVKIMDKTREEWLQEHPVLGTVMLGEEVFWPNPRYDTFTSGQTRISLTQGDVEDADARLNRFARYLSKVFPETRKTRGMIESPLIRIPRLQQALMNEFQQPVTGELLLKCDSHLPVSGSVKARGGIYEVLKHAETLALENKLITMDADYAVLADETCRHFFSTYSLAVGSTGNLGLSIGIMGAQMGFKVFVHMSANASQWKKDLLRKKGVTVVEYSSDYSRAVSEGRKQAAFDPNMHFIDDEHSTDLFLGYAVAASRLIGQLDALNIRVDKNHPLFVYLPCGVGGAPGGITFGLKQVFKDNVHCFFAEPTASPCMLLGLITQCHDRVSVRDFGLNNVTDADGLAVGTPSGFVGKSMEKMISGVYTVADKTLFHLLRRVRDVEKIWLEPSALAGFPGVFKLCRTAAGQQYLDMHKLGPQMPDATHIVWATGGSMVPEPVLNAYYQKAGNI